MLLTWHEQVLFLVNKLLVEESDMFSLTSRCCRDFSWSDWWPKTLRPSGSWNNLMTFRGGGNSNNFLFVTPTWGRFPLWRAYFSNGLSHYQAALEYVTCPSKGEVTWMRFHWCCLGHMSHILISSLSRRWYVLYIYLAILCDLFGMVKWPFQRLSDLQLGDKKVTLNHLVHVFFFQFFFFSNICWSISKITSESQLSTSEFSQSVS